MSLHSELLAQAQYLVRREPRRPRQASLRRSVSSAYYALFHLLIDEGSRRLVSGTQRSDLRQTLARAFTHQEMKIVAERFSKGTVPPRLANLLPSTSIPTQLQDVAMAFVELQQARHEADYNLSKRFSRQEAVDLVEMASDAFASWKMIRRTVEADIFLVGLLINKQIRA